MSKFTLILDSSQISCFLECPQLWYYKYKLRLIPAHYEQDRTVMNSGTYGHKLLDIYYKNRACGLSFDESAGRAFAYNVDTDTCECGCHVDNHKLIAQLNIKECTRCKHCTNFRPKPFNLDTIHRMQVQQRVREYFYKYQHDDIVPRSPDHVEIGFSELLFEDSQNLFVVEGRMDLLGTWQGLNVVADHKFQFKTHYLYPRSVQLKNYALFSKTTLAVYNYVRLIKDVKPTNLQRVTSSFTVPELLAWKQELIRIFLNIKEALLLLDRGYQFPKNWNSCKGYSETYKQEEPKYCIYNPMCESINEDIRSLKQSGLYQINREVWKPW